MIFGIKNPPNAFGFDLSDKGVKIAQFSKYGRYFKVDVMRALTINEGLVVNGEIQNIEQLGTELSKLLLPYKKQLVEGAIASLPESKSFIQTIVIPKSGNSTLPSKIEEILPEYLPLPLDEMYYDNSVISETDKEWQVIIGASPKKIVDSYIQLLEALQLIPVALDIQAMAIVRAVLPINESSYRTRAVIDIGRHRSSLITFDHNTIQFTMSLPIWGAKITETIGRELNLSIEQAEKAKIICGLDPDKCEGVLRTILKETVENLVKKISEARDFYQDHFANSRDFEEILLTGGDSYLLSLDSILADVLKIPVKLGNPWENTRLASAPKVESPLQYSTVLGLALRGVEGELII